MEQKKRLFIDMDGTLAVFNPVNTLEKLYEPGYFKDLEPIQSVLEAVKIIKRQAPEIEVNILSAYLSDSPYALDEKNAWLDRYLPEIGMENRIFPPCGADKKVYIPGGAHETDYLLDDYTYNLQQWEPPAHGIKLLNGINHTRGTWQHDRLRFDKSSQRLADDIISIINGHEQIRDNKPQVNGQGFEVSLNDTDRTGTSIIKEENTPINDLLVKRSRTQTIRHKKKEHDKEYEEER